ncbi:phage terminase large subunit [Ethanoligenens sp.]|uniref:phage terminase large subunit n=1 Tax=Ethanoligenens sp. TaxID=2099655 RepID=UPI0039E8A780
MRPFHPESHDGIEQARTDFFTFCHLRAPDFYKRSRTYLAELCHALQTFYESNDEILILNLPPRHGKSRTAGLFVQWVFGQYPAEKIMTGSYNERLSGAFSKTVRDGISEKKADPSKVVYTNIFPNIRVRRGEAASNLWALDGQYSSYLATSPSGTATGFGCTLLIIDDIVKNAYEAHNALLLDEHWRWFTDTMLSRVEENGKILLIMTRWATGDLAGRALRCFTEQGRKPRLVEMKAMQEDGTMLCPEILSRRSYANKIRLMGADIASANYQQEPIDLKGQLYTHFQTYEQAPSENGEPSFTERLAYVDTADTGSDSLCAIIWGVYGVEAYVLDIYYTKAPMEVTEPELARRLATHEVTQARIESNNGGRGFARAVMQHLEQDLHCYRAQVRWFAQTQNKQARILTAAPWVMEHLYFPADWRTRWPDYSAALSAYQRTGKNTHDDAPDATSGVAETMQRLQEG